MNSRRLLPAVAAALATLSSPPAVPAVECAGISEAPATALTTVRITPGLTKPLFVTAPPGDVERLFVLEQDGKIRIIKNGVLLSSSFLDVSSLARSPADGGGNEEGLLGLAFDPNYAASRRFFIYHTDVSGGSNIVARYLRSLADPDMADSGSRQVVISFPHPSFDNHNGGMMAFGPGDGYLYIATGDGGSGCDPNDNAQNGLSNLGKLHRIDVSTLPYTIPASNPYVPAHDPGDAFNDEIWSLGLRNPWRFSFAGPLSGASGDLYIGDVGQNQWEEINYRPAAAGGGGNYGWDLYEGDHCPNPSCTGSGCLLPGYAPPVLEYSSAGASPCSVTGGYVYGGCRMPALRGTYFYADYCAAFIKSLRIVSGAVTDLQDRTLELAPGGGMTIRDVTSFGEDARGEIYIVDRGTESGTTGELYKIVPVLNNMEVSGDGAAPLALSASDWTWEDLTATSSHPIQAYKVYRSAGNGGGTFPCVHQGPAASWTGGDPDIPPPGGLYSYVIAAENAAGIETSPGTGTSGMPRSLSFASCPP